MEFDPVPYAIPAFVALILLEMFWAKRRSPTAYEPRDTLTSLALGLGSTAVGVAAAGGIFAFAMWLYSFRIYTFGWEWWVWALAFVADDLGYYIGHRLGHRVRWFWASHINHHSSQHYNLSTALRQTWTGPVALSFLFRLPLALAGFHPAMLATCAGFNLIYQFWIHTEAIGRLPRWIEWLMNTPSHHRVHHATNPRYLDRNYAGVFIVWDRLFRSFTPEEDTEPARYGITRQLGSFNLFWAAFHEWIAIGRDVWSAPWRAKWGYVWRVPGWSHDGSRETSDMIRARWLEREQQAQALNLNAMSAMLGDNRQVGTRKD
jgi:sterol desaturase/sphingolipid hydroxylase (fatty acid hydroxylase superfamily)